MTQHGRSYRKIDLRSDKIQNKFHHLKKRKKKLKKIVYDLSKKTNLNMKFSQIEKLFKQGKYKDILDYALKSKKDDIDMWSAAMSMSAQLTNIESLELAGVDVNDIHQLRAKFIKSLIGFIQRLNDSKETVLLNQNEFVTLTKFKEIYIFTWFSIAQYNDYLITFSICLGHVKNDSNGEKLIKVLVDNRLLDEQEIAKTIDYRLAAQMSRAIHLLNSDADFVVFTVFNGKNIYTESFIDQIYKSGKIESRFFTDYDLALLKLEKYEG